MCIVIDADTLSCVFIDENNDHHEFSPIQDWIINGKGKMVIGGTKYDRELKAVKKLTKFIVELSRANKVRPVDSKLVDNKEKELIDKVHHRDFDDQHIVAIVVISGVNLICTNDKRAIPFLTSKLFYSGRKAPKIYSSSKNSNLLTNKYCGKCRITCKKPNKDTSSHLESTKEKINKKNKH